MTNEIALPPVPDEPEIFYQIVKQRVEPVIGMVRVPLVAGQVLSSKRDFHVIDWLTKNYPLAIRRTTGPLAGVCIGCKSAVFVRDSNLSSTKEAFAIYTSIGKKVNITKLQVSGSPCQDWLIVRFGDVIFNQRHAERLIEMGLALPFPNFKIADCSVCPAGVYVSVEALQAAGFVKVKTKTDDKARIEPEAARPTI